MSAPDCPTREELFAYFVGQLPEDAAEPLIEHLDTCSHCQDSLTALSDADDPLVGQLRISEPESPYTGEPECREAIAQAERLLCQAGPKPGTVSGQVARDLALPCELGEYQLLEKVGKGGMGTFYKALHTKLDKAVALKLLPHSRLADEKALARFGLEMKAVGRLNHPHLVQAHDAREIKGIHFLVLEYLGGVDLSSKWMPLISRAS